MGGPHQTVRWTERRSFVIHESGRLRRPQIVTLAAYFVTGALTNNLRVFRPSEAGLNHHFKAFVLHGGCRPGIIQGLVNLTSSLRCLPADIGDEPLAGERPKSSNQRFAQAVVTGFVKEDTQEGVIPRSAIVLSQTSF